MCWARVYCEDKLIKTLAPMTVYPTGLDFKHATTITALTLSSYCIYKFTVQKLFMGIIIYLGMLYAIILHYVTFTVELSKTVCWQAAISR
jgi:hypothetical protein